MRHRVPGLILAATLAAGCNEQSPLATAEAAPASVEVAPAPRPAGCPVDYTGWPSLTAEPVRLDPHLYTFCDISPQQRKLGPHFTPLARYYVNPSAADAVRRGATPVPVGTTVLKVKTWGDRALGGNDPPAYALMVKREPGYDPAGGDWEYVYSSPQEDGRYATERGKIESCANCHRLAKDRDFLFRSYLKK